MKNRIGLIVSDERLSKSVQNLLTADDGVELAGTYASPAEADDIRHADDLLIIYGIGRDHGKSLDELRAIQLSGPYPIIGVGSVADAAPILFDGFRLGMLDFIALSPEMIEDTADSPLAQTVKSIGAAGGGSVDRITRAKLKPFKEAERSEPSERAAYYVVLGVPRGGMACAVRLLTQLPRRRDTALVVTLPIPPASMAPFIADLNPYAQWSVRPALEGEEIYGGGCYLFSYFEPYGVEGAADGKCRIVTRTGNDRPIDSIMQDLSGPFGGSVVGVLLEGIGSDGIDGLSAVKSKGGTTLTIKPGAGVLTAAAAGAFAEGAADLLVDGDDLPKALAAFMAEMYDIANINRLLTHE
jgi:two-component system chemotaxis response regulator CheB